MIIEQNLPQFENEKSLLVLTGEQVARFYLVFKGVMQSLEPLEIPVEKYSDREGYFERRSGGKFTSGGSVYEDHKRYIHTTFTHALRKRLDDFRLTTGYAKIYLFAPKFISNEIRRALPIRLKEMLTWQAAGNFMDKHPFELLQMIKTDRSKNLVQLVRLEALKLEKIHVTSDY